MRRWHKFFAPWFALLLFLLALTGVATQLTSVLDTPAAKPAAAATTSAPKEAKSKGEPPRSALRSWNRWVKHLHSGESLGPVGIALNLAGGVALLFFAGSGFWMWLSMALRLRRSRRARAR